MDVTGERIRKRRTALNISQAELAEQVGYKNKTTITKIESGKISPPRSKVVEIAKALQTSPAYLMGGRMTHLPKEITLSQFPNRNRPSPKDLYLCLIQNPFLLLVTLPAALRFSHRKT